MKKGFEDAFMDIQIGLISLCLEGASFEVDKVYAYAYIGEGNYMFNTFFEYNNSVLRANRVISESLLPQVLRLGNTDLKKLKTLCAEYETQCPVEMKMYYDCKTKKYHAEYNYKRSEYEVVSEFPEEHFINWRNEIALTKTNK